MYLTGTGEWDEHMSRWFSGGDDEHSEDDSLDEQAFDAGEDVLGEDADDFYMQASEEGIP